MELNRQRITVVDGICGVRLLGVLMANVLIFQYGLSMKKTS
ncbi:putative membrane protein [Brevibacillus laterosporus GI-9]|nr:putative membrane protein [Brevibacillus laterosporus GI-9]